MGISEGKRSLGRPILRWKVNFKMDLRKVVFDAGDGQMLLKIGSNGELL